MTENGQIALVTGASRGAGRGIARALGSHGCTVYVTGRTLNPGDAEVPGTIFATAQEVTEAGGKGIAVKCDHANDAEVKALIERIIDEQGRLDILVNNACYQSHAISAPGQFWEKPLEIAEMMNVGLRSGFVASWYAAPHMVKQEKGLIVFTSSPGAAHYCFGPCYGAQKAGVDKMAHDMGVDFSDAGANVAAVSIWMGPLTTERLLEMMEAAPDKFSHLEGKLESTEYTGHIAWAMFNDPDLMDRWNGKVVIGAEVGREIGLMDVGDKYPLSVRSTTATDTPVFAKYKVK
ncbi:NAD(P)-dependent dehydrogenase (short-subunit alcohol dehydrogenase family) [Novosphingobium sp. PhB165]|uniref:SDR family NAD(P)-dependent oxidoreductase n=1 Tax=Novosphingobium sp. PhB165 TaxID=2485105 RepID=UPI00104F7977|nr:SDR family NAD(P)-dependent oxidoreductase [Novosphingobium sp. PhB165]TCM20684.1 NAD(P)-dependent dehydrogenase (short-subunit alcohol dehydrogenase family) [Novosphingobium sp. PhB165]